MLLCPSLSSELHVGTLYVEEAVQEKQEKEVIEAPNLNDPEGDEENTKKRQGRYVETKSAYGRP